MRNLWTEEDVAAFPPGEHDYFDRKGAGWIGKPTTRADLAKALSAFANSGGGQLLVGVEDDGTMTGVDRQVGRTPKREWFEQRIPNELESVLSTFRVHEVQPSGQARIPAGKVVMVIDVGDSHDAPRQCHEPRLYYYPAGRRPVPAPPGTADSQTWHDNDQASVGSAVLRRRH